jgi:hypothetical protein
MTKAALTLSAVALAVVLGGLAGSPAFPQGSPPHGACRPPAQNTLTFLPSPPPDSGYEVMAQVELVNLVDAHAPSGGSGDAAASKVRVRVLFAIKGVGRDQSFVVDTGGGGCDEIVGLDRLGQKAFIAGRFVTDRTDSTYFVGQHDLPAR